MSQMMKSKEQSQLTIEKKEIETPMSDEEMSDENIEYNRPRVPGKNTPGYIKRYRRVNLIWLIVWIAVGIGIFFIGIGIFKTRANLLTVLAVLMVLPGAKRLVALIAAGRRRSVSFERCDRIKSHLGKDDEFFTDYIFTSTERVMMLEFMIVTKKKVLALIVEGEKDVDYVKTYFTNGVKKNSDTIGVRYVKDDDELIRELDKIHGAGDTTEVDPKEWDELIRYLQSLAL